LEWKFLAASAAAAASWDGIGKFQGKLFVNCHFPFSFLHLAAQPTTLQPAFTFFFVNRFAISFFEKDLFSLPAQQRTHKSVSIMEKPISRCRKRAGKFGWRFRDNLFAFFEVKAADSFVEKSFFLLL